MVIAGMKVHILGEFGNTCMARKVVVGLILERTLGRVDRDLKGVAEKAKAVRC
jgi:rRNA processing protein Krr1/Pno1